MISQVLIHKPPISGEALVKIKQNDEKGHNEPINFLELNRKEKWHFVKFDLYSFPSKKLGIEEGLIGSIDHSSLR